MTDFTGLTHEENFGTGMWVSFLISAWYSSWAEVRLIFQKKWTMRKEAHVLAFEGKTPKSLAIPLMAECHCSIRQAAFCNRRTKRICWSTVLVCALSPGRAKNITLILCRGEEAVGLYVMLINNQRESLSQATSLPRN